MYTAIILMCTTDMWCYPITYQDGFLKSREECEQAIVDLVNHENFDIAFRFFEEGKTYNLESSRCINWEEKDI